MITAKEEEIIVFNFSNRKDYKQIAERNPRLHQIYG
jgi:hypothetical protein